MSDHEVYSDRSTIAVSVLYCLFQVISFSSQSQHVCLVLLLLLLLLFGITCISMSRRMVVRMRLYM